MKLEVGGRGGGMRRNTFYPRCYLSEDDVIREGKNRVSRI